MAYASYINIDIIVDGVPTGDFQSLGADHPHNPVCKSATYHFPVEAEVNDAPQFCLNLAGADVIGNYSVFATATAETS